MAWPTAPGPALAASAGGDSPNVTVAVETVDQPRRLARWMGLSPDGGLQVVWLDETAPAAPSPVTLYDWLTVTVSEPSDGLPRSFGSPERMVAVTLRGSDRLSGEIIAGGGETLTLRLAVTGLPASSIPPGNPHSGNPTAQPPQDPPAAAPPMGVITLALTEIAAIHPLRLSGRGWGRPFPSGGPALRSDRATDPLGEPPTETDVLIFTNGDRFRGLVEAVSPAGVDISPPQGGAPRRIAWPEIAALVLAEAGDVAPLAADKLALELTLRDTSRLTAAKATLRLPQILITRACGASVSLPLTAVAAAAIVRGPVISLANLVPTDTETVAPLGALPSRPPRRDANVVGGPLTVAGRIWLVGWGTAGRTRLSFDLAPGCQTLVTEIGLDDAASGAVAPAIETVPAAMVFRIYADGRLVGEQSNVRWGATAHRWVVDLAEARTLTLEVESSPALEGTTNWGGWANWLNPRLVRRPQRPGVR